jgi:hypothetical protein
MVPVPGPDTFPAVAEIVSLATCEPEASFEIVKAFPLATDRSCQSSPLSSDSSAAMVKMASVASAPEMVKALVSDGLELIEILFLLAVHVSPVLHKIESKSPTRPELLKTGSPKAVVAKSVTNKRDRNRIIVDLQF